MEGEGTEVAGAEGNIFSKEEAKERQNARCDRRQKLTKPISCGLLSRSFCFVFVFLRSRRQLTIENRVNVERKKKS